MASIDIHASQDDNDEEELNKVIEQNTELQEKLAASEHESKQLEKQLRKVPRFRKSARQKPATTTKAPDSSSSDVYEVDPVDVILPPEIKASLDKPPSNQLIMTDEKLEARIDNLFRTLNSKSFKERNVTQEPFFEKLFDKATKAEDIESLMSLVKQEQDKQQSSILAYQTNLDNQLALLKAEVDTRLENMQGEEEVDSDRVDRYKSFQENLNTIQESVRSFVSEAIATLEQKTFDTASKGKAQGDIDRELKEIDQQLKDAIKKEKEASKIIQEFDKAFDKYAQEKKKEAASEFAYNEALQAKKKLGSSQASVSKTYHSAKDSFLRNTPDLIPQIDDDSKISLYASQGGTFKSFNFSTIPVSFSSRKNGGGGNQSGGSGGGNTGGNNTGSNSPLPPNFNQPPSHNSPVLTFGDFTQALKEFAMSIREVAKVLTVDALSLGVKSTSKEGATAGDAVKFGAKGARAGADITGQLAGAVAGAFVGGPFGGLLGSQIGKVLANVLPIEEFAESISLLEQMANNTAERATPFSFELIATKIDKQLAMLDQDMTMGRLYGDQLSSIQRSSNEVQLELKRSFDEFVVALSPLIIGILEQIKFLITLLTPMIAAVMGYIMSLAPMTFLQLMANGTNRINQNRRNRANNRAGNQAEQLDDNVPFL